jgi:hypothetical protein
MIWRIPKVTATAPDIACYGTCALQSRGLTLDG